MEASEPVIEILWIGEDGQWLLAEGHHDLAEFAAAADSEYFYTSGLDPDEDAPSEHFDAVHAYWRPMTYEECVEANDYLVGEPNYEDLIAARWQEYQQDGYMKFVSQDEPGATPITYIETGA